MKTLRQLFESIIGRVAAKGDPNAAAEIANELKSGNHVEAYVKYHEAMKKIRAEKHPKRKDGEHKTKWKPVSYGPIKYSPTANYPKKH
jgi:hypothetical protein